MAIIISKKGSQSQVVDKSDFALERNLQDYICDHPEAIPVEDKRLLVVARELQTESGPIDAFAVDRDGDLYIVETKLYRNPDKRTVVAQHWITARRSGVTPISTNSYLRSMRREKSNGKCRSTKSLPNSSR